MDRLLLQPPDHIADAGKVRLVGVTRHDSPGGAWTQHSLAYPDVLGLEKAQSFGSAAYGYPDELTLAGGIGSASVHARMVSYDFFSLLGMSPEQGRVFTEEDDQPGTPLTAVLSHELWTRHFGADPAVLGRSVELSGEDYAVIGIAPEGFTGVTLEPVDVWLPVEPVRTLQAGGSTEWRDRAFDFWIAAVVRLNADATPEVAEQEATAVHRAARREDIEADEYDPEALVELAPLVAAGGTPEGRVAKWLLGVAFVVLLIACANVTNLLLARGAQSRKESAVRLALGMTRRRQALHRSLEAVCLALVGGGVAGTLMVVALAASLVPGWRATRVDPMAALNTE